MGQYDQNFENKINARNKTKITMRDKTSSEQLRKLEKSKSLVTAKLQVCF